VTAVLDPVFEFEVEPIYYGPTWQKDDDGNFVLPKWTIGWQALKWARENLHGFDGDELILTPEQVRFILWWYAVDENGRFAYREGVLQRLKGWGKDPLVAIIACIEFLGPCRFAGWAAKAMPERGLVVGDPYAVENPNAWIQVAAVTQEQTKNTMTLFPNMISMACQKAHQMNAHSFGATLITSHRGGRRIQAVTSNPAALEGGRPTFVIKNETHHWQSHNRGLEMAAVITRNATKAKGGAARTLSITNAYEPSETSVAKAERETWEEQEAGLAIKTRRLYDSIEAPEDAGMMPPRMRTKDYVPPADDDFEGQELEDAEIKAYIAAIISAVRGDASWLDVEGIVDSILDKNNPISTSRRFWFNQIVADEDAWVDHLAVDAGVHELVRGERERARRSEGDALRAGWNIVSPTDPVVMTFDGSKTDDATVLNGTRLSDGYSFVIGIWQDRSKRDPKKPSKYLIPREAVSARVDEAFERFNIVAFWGDPSHAKDDSNEAEMYWDPYFDRWHRKYSERIDKRFWAVQSGHKVSMCMWDMTSPQRQEEFTAAAMVVHDAIMVQDDFGTYLPRFLHDGHPALLEHLKNARRAENKWGVSVRKEGRESPKKIDLGVGLILGQMLAKVVLNLGMVQEPVRSGVVY